MILPTLPAPTIPIRIRARLACREGPHADTVLRCFSVVLGGGMRRSLNVIRNCEPTARTEEHQRRSYLAGPIFSQNRALHELSLPAVRPINGSPVAPFTAAACPCSARTSSLL